VRASGGDWWTLWTACNLWTAAFFLPITRGNSAQIPTSADLRRYLANPLAGHGQMVGAANALAVEHPFLHWPLEFPDVFAEGGFDVVLCNPPWERIKLQEQEFFAARDPEIARAPNKAARERLIAALPQAKPALWREYQAAKHAAEASSRFLRASEQYPLTARGDINTYSVFAELFTQLASPTGRVGMIVPTGIATDDTNKHFFADLVDSQRLLQLVGFENEAFIFPAVHNEFKFCALTAGGEQVTRAEPDYLFFCRYFHQVQQPQRHFTLTRDDIACINPNTHTCPIFRTKKDAELTLDICQRVPVLVNEETGKNPWGVSFLRMLDMANDSAHFRTPDQLSARGFALVGNRFRNGGDVWLPLYEAKMIWQFDHRFGSLIGVAAGEGRPSRKYEGWYGVAPDDPVELAMPRYWVDSTEIGNRLAHVTPRRWLIGFRDVTNVVVERTAVFSLLPRVGVGHTMPLVFTRFDVVLSAGLLGNMNAIALDYVVRQKVGGTHLTYSYLRQLPVLPPASYTVAHLAFLVARVLELVYTAWDVKPFADDLWREADEGMRATLRAQWEANVQASGGHVGAQPPPWVEPAPDGFPYPPFKWDEERRSVLRAELDAYYARLYGLTEEELRYILDPADVYGPDFPGETFRVLKEKEIKQLGEYRTRRLVLEAWGRLNH
jgi:hypothetical protein